MGAESSDGRNLTPWFPMGYRDTDRRTEMEERKSVVGRRQTPDVPRASTAADSASSAFLTAFRRLLSLHGREQLYQSYEELECNPKTHMHI